MSKKKHKKSSKGTFNNNQSSEVKQVANKTDSATSSGSQTVHTPENPLYVIDAGFKPWPNNIRRFKDFSGLAIIAIGTIVGILTLCQIKRQVDTAVEQTDAVWYSTRPIIVMEIIDPGRDIFPYLDSIETSQGKQMDTTKIFSLRIFLKNVGKSPAVVDTIYFELFDSTEYITSYIHMSTVLLPTESIQESDVPLKLNSDRVNFLRIHFDYNWEQRHVSNKPFEFLKDYRFEKTKAGWTVELCSTALYDSLKVHQAGVQTSGN